MSLAGLRVTVTGAGGFLGTAAVRALAREGALVHAVVGPPDEPARLPLEAARVSRADVCDEDAVREVVAGADAIVHLAGPASVAASFRDPVRFVRVHAGGTAAVLQACAAARVRRIVHVSSAEVYGRPLRTPVGEDHPLAARSPYAAAKIGAEKLVEAFVHARGPRAVILRPFSVYGPGASPQALVPEIIAMARRGGPLVLRDLRPVRDYCFVADVAEAIVAACRLEHAGLEVCNVGTMRGTSVASVAALVLRAMDVDLPVREEGARDRPGESEIHDLVADIGRARRALRWEPAISLEEGLRLTVKAEGT